ncbi:MAG: efflux RND transporter periplasmic adaptor subunit [Spirochaeta sp.]|jgi:membrane fusion protein (multidrug efflux system)|nr:efflux RND transporter periplasmic adaptor subunit [Spirochaeta sp.]
MPHNLSGRHLALILVAVMTTALLAGCNRGDAADDAARSIDEIHESDGIPVSVRPVEPTEFRTYLTFTSSVSGATESTASAKLADAVARVAHRVGEYVEQDTPVVFFPTDNPALNFEQARVSFESARTAFERVGRLYEDDGVSQQAYDDARTQFELARANWNSAQDMAQVKAPISGYITRLNVLESDNVQPGDPLFTVADFARLKTTVWLTDRQVSAVEMGQPAVARWQNEEIRGEVVQVDMAMDHDRKAFATKLRFDNPELAISSGVTAVVEIETYRNDSALILNDREIIYDGDRAYVYLLTDGTVERRPVEITNRQGLIVEIARDISPGTRVITRGIEQITEGTAVRVVNEDERLVQR